MSQTNGKHLDTDRLREEAANIRAQAELAQARAELALWETTSAFGMGWGPGWGDLVDPFLFRRDDFGTMWLPNGAGALYGRQDGRNRPFVWTDIDLDRSRSLSRWLATRNPFAQGAIRTIRDYTIKKGYKWEARPAAGLENDFRASELAKQVQRIIDEFSDLNGLPARERSSCARAVRDGEVFVRLFRQEDGRVLVRFVEPEQVREPPGADRNSAFGIETEPGDVERPLAYHITYDGTEYDQVPASEVCHLKRNVDECVKRGLSDFYSVGESFDGVNKLLRNMREAGAVQAAIAWIEQFESSTSSQVGAHVAAVKDLNRPQIQHPLSGRNLDYQKFEPGTIVKVGKGKEYLPAPLAGNTTNHTSIVQACLRALGVRWGIPEHMISGDASNNNYACHDSETELLTRRGWLKYDQILSNDLAATMNPDTGAFEWQSIQAIHIHDHSGELVHFKGRDFDVLVTPNHRMYAARHQNRKINGKACRVGLKPFEFVPADEIRDAHVLPLNLQPQVCEKVEAFAVPGVRHERYYKNDSSHPQAASVPMDAFLRFLGWWISEGWTCFDGAYHIGISQSSKQTAECEDIRRTMAQLPWHIRECESNSGMICWLMADKSLFTWLRSNCGTGSYTKCLPDFVFDLPAEQQQILLQALLLGDGCHLKNGSACYYTVSRKLIDQLQALALQCGYVSNETMPMTDQGGSTKFVLSIRLPGRAIKVAGKHIGRVRHEGKVWCVTVDNGLIVTRRNGKAIVTGNSILVTGSPFVNAVECDQDDFGIFFLRWRWIAVRIACEAGRIPGYSFADIQQLIDIHFTPPQVAVSNEGEQASIDHQDLAAGVMSIQTRRARRGLDNDQEERNLEEKPPTRVQGKFTDLDSQGNPVTQGSEEGGDPFSGAEEVKEETVHRRKGEVWKDPSGRYFTVNDAGHVVPAAAPGGEKDGQQQSLFPGADQEQGQTPTKKSKARATRGEMTSARREGAGKEARVILADGQPAPAHITPAMIGADWSDVKVSIDPDADVLVTGRDKNGRAKTVYSDAFHMKQAAVKFARTQEGLQLMHEMHQENQRNREDPLLREHADCVWLMQTQATRPGSEADNKGVSELFGQAITPDNVQVEGDKVTLLIGEQSVPVKDKKARAEIKRRLDSGEPLHDSSYWLKSHGATTLEGRHVVQKDDGVYLQFIGKESVWHSHRVRDPELAGVLLERKAKAGEGGKLFDTNYDKVTAYARTLDGGKFTPKDFRTQKATSLAVEEIRKMPVPKNEKDRKAAIKHVGEVVSGVLGNEAAQALMSYIDPSVFSVWGGQANG